MQKVRHILTHLLKKCVIFGVLFIKVRHFLTHLYEDMQIYITLGEPPMFWLAKTAKGLSSVAEQR